MTETDRTQQTQLIRFGDAGPAVSDVQRRLKRLGIAELDEDGVFEARTRDVVRSFQRSRGLPADGIVGPETWRALLEAGYALGDRLLWHSASMMRGDDVLELQQRLNQLGFNADLEDGIFGAYTRAAVEDFQRNVGLTVDGLAGPATIEALRRLRRDHQSPGAGVRAREREELRRMAKRGLSGARIMVDPAHGPAEPAPDGQPQDQITWSIATKLSGRLAASGADVSLSRGPTTTPSGSERARLANELGVDLVVSIGLSVHDSAIAQGASSFYFGSERYVSETGRGLAEHLHSAMVGAGWTPDCRAHPMTWALLRETRMPALVVQPGFITSPIDAERLWDPDEQDRLAHTLADSLGRFYTGSPHSVAS